ncbi:unnamed protein product [Brassicogethes aeneus]|uniref:RUN domain-containing protein n=1 Tax=Brassicogethes aeneus TaxID=1431903 RepID=A0A9P0FNH3_BRAAE|nr:unnamed protein product [Brassicogethes aeneus]
MSVSDPLLKDLKGCVLDLIKDKSTQGKISDENENISKLYVTLEKIFNFGLIKQQNTLYLNRTIDPYCWLSSCIKEKSDIITYTYINCVERVKDRGGLRNNLAKLRFLIKVCLVKKCLHVPLEFLLRTNKSQLFYFGNSIIGDEILSEIFFSVLLQIGKIYFNLDLENVSFLDLTLEVPKLLSLELVPCRTLGLSVSFCSDRAVIVDINSSGVAAETELIKIGDVLDKLNGKHVTASSKGKLNSILRTTRTQPVHLTIIKAYHEEKNEFFHPIRQFLKELKIDEERVRLQYRPSAKEEENEVKKSYGSEVLYLGFIPVGEDGSVKQMDTAIKAFLANKPHQENEEAILPTRLNKKVLFEIGEIGVRLRDMEAQTLFRQHTYMAISACGVANSLKNNFGYITSSKNEVCDQARNFVCHVFYSDNLEEINTILQSIGQGFYRTHFAV